MWRQTLVLYVVALLQMQFSKCMMSDGDGIFEVSAMIGSAHDAAMSAAEPPPPPELPSGPFDYASLFDWAPQYIAKMSEDEVGSLMVRLLRASLRRLQVNTDYSGVGSPEIALHSILQAALPGSRDNDHVLCWRASDILHVARRCLAANRGVFAPRHIFGDLLMRVGKATRTSLRRAYTEAEDEFNRRVSSCATRELAAEVAESCSASLMSKLHSIMTKVRFDLNAVAWCYKCSQPCRIHGPPGQSDRVRLSVAGTTCTSWSAMGKRKKWILMAPSLGGAFDFV